MSPERTLRSRDQASVVVVARIRDDSSIYTVSTTA